MAGTYLGEPSQEHFCSAQPPNQGIVFENLVWKNYFLGGGAPKLVMSGLNFCPFCGVRLSSLRDEIIAGKVQYGCIYHAEGGIPCEHNRVLAARKQ